jgi:ribosomal protein S18 acetylase RimI-like enzyme
MLSMRPARQEDRDAVVRLWEAAGFGETTDEEWQALAAGGNDSVIVADEDGRIGGTAVTAFDGWRAFLYHVAVDPASRRRGLAKALMTEAEQQMRSRGARRLFALVNENNTAGLALCAASGYEPEGDVAFVKEIAAG